MKLLNWVQIILSIVLLPLTILNLSAGIIAGIWLIIVGKLGLVIYAVIFSIVSVWIIALVLTPTMLFMVPVTKLIEKRRYFFAYILGSLSSLWVNIVMTVWCVWTFIAAINNHETGLILPYLLLGYAIATGPWTYMASKEKSSGMDATTVGCFFVCLGSFALLISALFFDPSRLAMIIIFAIGMCVAWTLNTMQFIYGMKIDRIERQAEEYIN